MRILELPCTSICRMLYWQNGDALSEIKGRSFPHIWCSFIMRTPFRVNVATSPHSIRPGWCRIPSVSTDVSCRKVLACSQYCSALVNLYYGGGSRGGGGGGGEQSGKFYSLT